MFPVIQNEIDGLNNHDRLTASAHTGLAFE